MNDSVAALPLQHVGVLGAGAWGTALAQVAAGAGREVTVWAFEPDLATAINANHVNALYLPDRALNPAINATSDLSALAACDVILAVPPAQHMRASLARLTPLLNGAPVVLCAKGVEQKSLALMSEVLAEAAPDAPAAVLSGPGFAVDVARMLPTATTIACADAALGARLVATIGMPSFRPYLTDDLIGAQIGGAVKNVIAIACGVAEGRKLGEGARAALITRGFTEMSRLGLAMGAKAETLNGLCGLGDLVLTCVSRTSRNTSFGIELGEGKSATEILSGRRSVAEGVATAPAVAALAKKFGVEMPICEAIDAVLAGRLSVEEAIGALLSRPFRAEGR
ncbi:MAG TPA: NAD(P)H-dependent glycerol-3-phosphate dehydrogenase [Caulobacterales bacterium]|nr:NAD(P)H-dependent glycerol-3-phosphate dehydrogenase [Caulobacterales bacterium]